MPACALGGYSWTMTTKPKDSAICVSPIYGGVGEILNDKCHITMAMKARVSNFSTDSQYHYIKFVLRFEICEKLSYKTPV